MNAAEKPTVGFIGIGLMGHGMAKNAVEKGYPLVAMAHRKREAIEDLVGRGAREVSSAAEMAAVADVVVMCVTGAPEVATNVAEIVGAVGRRTATIIDCSTSEPDLSARLAGELAEKGMDFIDAPLSRTPSHAWEGKLTTYVGGPADLIAKWTPLFETWAEVVIPTNGPVGSAHAVKLINNLVGIGYAAIWSEAYAMTRKVGLEPSVLHAIVTNSGLNCGNFQNYSKYPLEGEPNAHKFALANCLKDLTYYNRLASKANAATLVSDGVLQALKLGNTMGLGQRMMPEMGEIFLRLNGDSAEV